MWHAPKVQDVECCHALLWDGCVAVLWNAAPFSDMKLCSPHSPYPTLKNVAVPVGSYSLRCLLFRCIVGQGLVRLVAIIDLIIVPLTPTDP